MLIPTTVQISSRHQVPAGRASVIPKQTAGFSVYDGGGKQRFHLTFFDKSGRSEFKVVR